MIKKIVYITAIVVLNVAGVGAKEQSTAYCSFLQEFRDSTNAVISKHDSTFAIKIGAFERSQPAKLLGNMGYCEFAVNRTNSGTFINCWTGDVEFGARSDRSAIKEPYTTANTLIMAVKNKGLLKMTLSCLKPLRQPNGNK